MTDEYDLWQEETKNCRRLEKSSPRAERNRRGVPVLRKIPRPSANHEECADLDSVQALEKGRSLGIDRGTNRKLRAGKMKIDLEVDFHGLTLDRALDLLTESLGRAYDAGLRCILVVTGKGNNTESGRTTIKSQIGEWLKIPTLSSKIIEYVDATPKHGGRGALYILLKRHRE
ncbi:MAG: Smr/MutS family protein [Rickettsiales bacterium]|jgi:DNA-nicking Smr family endonuclease|nr:Smr/MutS family protein [Rickettsiales bacterium]